MTPALTLQKDLDFLSARVHGRRSRLAEGSNLDELCRIRGTDEADRIATLRLAPADTRVANPAFDVTPAALVSAIVTERGVAAPGELDRLYPERQR